MKGQLSAEMLILIVVILAIVALLASTLLGQAHSVGKEISEKSQKIVEKADKAVKKESGEFCVDDEECASNSCINNRCS